MNKSEAIPVWTHEIVDIAPSSDAYPDRDRWRGMKCCNLKEESVLRSHLDVPEGYKRLHMLVELHSGHMWFSRQSYLARSFNGVIVKPLEPPDDPTWNDEE